MSKELIRGKVNKHFRKNALEQYWAFELSLILLNRLTSSRWKYIIKSQKACDRALTLPHLTPDASGLSYLIIYTGCLSLEIILWVKNKKQNFVKQFHCSNCKSYLKSGVPIVKNIWRKFLLPHYLWPFMRDLCINTTEHEEVPLMKD